jgi:hypothetical protein
MSVTILAKWHLAQNAMLATRVSARLTRNATRSQRSRSKPVGGSKWADARRPVQTDGRTDAGSADQQTADGADGAARGRRASTQKAPRLGNK